MSATTMPESNAWGKRSLEDDAGVYGDLKRPRYNYFRLASESSRGSEEDEEESVVSLQDQDTDVIHDTTDTEGKSDNSDRDNEYEVEIEYEVASLSEEDENYSSSSSTGSQEMMMAAAAVAAVIYDTSLEVTDSEDSDSSAIDTAPTAFSTCIQCKFENKNPLYRYCEKCFQQICRQCKKRKTYKGFQECNVCYKDRKKDLPPRPRGFRRRNATKPSRQAVKLDNLQSCLSGLSQFSQDSGVGSSQESHVSATDLCSPTNSEVCPPLDLGGIVVPEHHRTTKGTSSSGSQDISSSSSSSGAPPRRAALKRSVSDSLWDSEPDGKRARVDNKGGEECGGSTAELVSEGESLASSAAAAAASLCMFCNSAPKDGIFLHTNMAHVCCCYKCAKKTLNTTKRCPICNLTVNKVVRIFMS